MKFYKTSKGNIINLEHVDLIYADDEARYTVAFKNEKEYMVPELTEEDIDRIMEYNNHFIDQNLK